MTRIEAARIFGNYSALARALSITSSAVSQWPDELPQAIVDRVVGAAIRLGLDWDRTTADAPMDAGIPNVATPAAAEPSTIDGEAA